MRQSDDGIVPWRSLVLSSRYFKLVRSEPMQSGIVPGLVGGAAGV